MEKQRIFIEAKNQKGNLKIVSDISDTLTLPETGVLWQKEDTEYIFFSKEKWERFVREMKKNSGITPTQFEFTEKGRDFLRRLCSRGTPVDINETMMVLGRGRTMKKKLFEGIARVEFCI